MFRNIQPLLDMLQRSHNFRILILLIKICGTHQSTMFRNIQPLLDMLQRSHNFRILILLIKICDKEINNLFGSVLLFKQFAYTGCP